MEFFTIGVYNSSQEQFFNKLTENNIDTFCDIRQRRGVRGAKYAFVNSNRLQTRLHELDIKYGHEIALAPTTNIRMMQKEADAQLGEYKRDRSKLGEVFTNAYIDDILSEFNFDKFLEMLDEIAARKIALFCVEAKPEACHRSMVGDKLQELGYEVVNL